MAHTTSSAHQEGGAGMSRDHRMTLGYNRDAREGAALLGSVRSVQRMVAALDDAFVSRRRTERIAAALSRLSRSDRAFATAVLEGMTKEVVMRRFGISKATFYRKLEKISNFIKHQ